MPALNIAPAAGAQDHADIIGLRVRLRPCRRCQYIAARIVKGDAIACDSCGKGRGRLDHQTQRFLRDFIAIFGRPTSPIEIKPSTFTETSPLPSGAGADDVTSSAPTGEIKWQTMP